MVYQNIDQVTQVLAERYDGPTYEVNKGNQGTFTYVPWTESVEILDQVFGVFGWTATAPQVVSANGFVHVSFAITVRVMDEAGNVIEKTVPCVGSAAERDDNAAKSAFSDAFNKGVKFLGDKFARYLSKEGKANRNGGTGTGNGGGSYPQRQGQSNGNGNGNGARQPYTGGPTTSTAPASAAQVGKLVSLGVDRNEAQALNKAQASKLIDELMNS